MGWLAKAAEPIYALLRFFAGGMLACHGAQKVLGAFAGAQGPPAARMVAAWLGDADGSPASDLLDGMVGPTGPHLSLIGLIALAGGLLIAAGLFAGPAALAASVAMAVNYLLWHAAGGFWPIVNRGELAVLYGCVFLYVAARGSGRFGIDAVWRKTAAA